MRSFFSMLFCVGATAAMWLAPASSSAEDAPSLEAAAAQVQGGVCTVRVLDVVAEASGLDAEKRATRPKVTVCTGVCVEKGWVITPAFAGSDSQIRLTLPGGQQASAQLKVIDEYSGLALLAADTKGLTPLVPAEPAKVGAWVLSAAAWGVEEPVISLGILSGHDRTAGGLQYPPLLQADLRTTETSSGAALVDRHGKLLGVVVLVDEGQDRRGWTYAVPVSHVQRLLRARVEPRAGDEAGPQEDKAAADDEKKDTVVVLKRRRPVVGVRLDGIGESVVITRVEKNSPAERAGLKVGDVIKAVDGVKIRSVYQAGKPVIYKQPGDLVTYEVQQGEVAREVQVTLGGGVELPNASVEALTEYIRPKVDVEGTGSGRYVTRTGQSDTVREVRAPGEPEVELSTEQRLRSPAEQVKLLEKALERYRAVIAYQQGQLSEREADRQETEERIRQLEQELERLKTKMAEPK